MARILIAEDDDTVSGFVRRAVELDAHHAETVADGAVALARLEAHGFAYDLLIADVVLPGLDGLTLAREAVRLHPALAVLLMSGHAEAAGGDGTGTHAFLMKPFSLNQLKRTVAALVAPRQQGMSRSV